jgi:predicted DCC family thiol-disulfide oxidoreductase YuxK
MDEPAVTTFYNGACPVCRAEMTVYRRRSDAAGLPLVFCDVAADARGAAQHGISADQALRRLYAVDAEGRLYRGYDAMLAVWKRVPRTRWLARLFGNRLTVEPSAWLYEHLVSATLYRWSKRRQARAARSSNRASA